MTLFNFKPSNENSGRSPKSLKLILGIAVLAGVVGIGSTLAANINLNAGAAVEFGQGIAQTVSCDSDGITLTPYSTFVNDGENSDFYFSSVEVSGVSAACTGKVFKLKAYMDGNSDPLYWPSNPYGNSFEFGFNSSESWYEVGSCMSMLNETTDSTDNNNVTIDWSECVPGDAEFAGSVDRITVETSDTGSSDFIPAVYHVGDTGPGGGTIFFVKSVGTLHKEFTETGYCEMMSMCETFTFDLTAPEQAALPFKYLEAKATGNDLVSWSSYDHPSSSGSVAAFGSGESNTNGLVSEFPGDTTLNNAAVYADSYSTSLKNDWFLPSYQELLLLMLLNANAKINEPNYGSVGTPYWSSTSSDGQNSESSASNQLHGFINLNSPLNILVIRSFS